MDQQSIHVEATMVVQEMAMELTVPFDRNGDVLGIRDNLGPLPRCCRLDHPTGRGCVLWPSSSQLRDGSRVASGSLAPVILVE